ncbi:uncharacterized protein LOC142345473 [Convolutriloba macropyga]|uniref:uncharacterized protein LOC142345473 n=1 Tax=Convolutriloba macropyga TaxID=536237 RepID=UPI003F51FB56
MTSETGCCPAGSLPELIANHKEEGETVDLPGGEIKLYIVGSGDKVVLHYYDIFGMNGGRTKFLCDRLAREVWCKVVMLDIYRGESCAGKPMTPEFLIPFVKQFTSQIVVADTKATIEYLKSEHKATTFAATGTCWGSWAIFHCCAEGVPLECGVNFHPSIRLEEMIGNDLMPLVNKVKVPQLMLPAGNDPENIKPGGEVIKAMEANGVTVEVKDYPKQIHGYMARADLSDAESVADIEDATRRAVAFLKKYLKV